MKIAILGWGSLIWDKRDLPIVGNWQKDGSKLWIEFSRISQKGERAGCLTLVLEERSEEESTSLYAVSQRTDMTQAIADLQAREGTPQDNIGFCKVAAACFAPNARSRHPKSCERIRAWALGKGFEAVIWSAQSRRFKDVLGIPFSPAAALNYLNGLPASTKEKAIYYIQKAPDQIMTPFRRLFLAQLPPGNK
jgi:hypothetical protein